MSFFGDLVGDVGKVVGDVAGAVTGGSGGILGDIEGLLGGAGGGNFLSELTNMLEGGQSGGAQQSGSGSGGTMGEIAHIAGEALPLLALL